MDSHTTETLLRWIVLVPLLGAVTGGLLNRRLPKKVAGLLACGTVGVSFALSATVFLRLTRMPAAERFVSDTLGTWIGFGNLQVDLGFSMDPLSGVMALVVTGANKRKAVLRLRSCAGFTPDWPASFIYECRSPVILLDRPASPSGENAS